MTPKTMSDVTLTEYLSAADNQDPSIDGPAALSHVQIGQSWSVDGGEELDADPDEYRVECSCGEEFGTWGAATAHVSVTDE